MIYLDNITFPDNDKETAFIWDNVKETCYDTYYPFCVLSKNYFDRIDFENITILYGGNGSGKSTALNIIANKIGADRSSMYNKSNFYEDYLDYCDVKFRNREYQDCRIITSDDVFDYMLDIRDANEIIDDQKQNARDSYLNTKVEMGARTAEDGIGFRMNSIDDYDELKRMNFIRSRTMSKYVRANSSDSIRELSNGESAFFYFTNRIKENGIYILDEPENSLSPAKQLELLKFIEDSARFFIRPVHYIHALAVFIVA